MCNVRVRIPVSSIRGSVETVKGRRHRPANKGRAHKQRNKQRKSDGGRVERERSRERERASERASEREWIYREERERQSEKPSETGRTSEDFRLSKRSGICRALSFVLYLGVTLPLVLITQCVAMRGASRVHSRTNAYMYPRFKDVCASQTRECSAAVCVTRIRTRGRSHARA